MKYKVLLCGKSKVIIDDFFIYQESEFELQTTSLRYADIMNHLKYFTPDILLFCMHQEGEEEYEVLASLRSKFEQYNTAVAIVGNEEECDVFRKKTGEMADLVLTKPIMVRKIGEEFERFLEQWKSGRKTINIDALDEYVKSVDQVVSDVAQNLGAAGKQFISKKHILVVDDDPMMLKLIKEQLKENYTVATAINGAIALNFLEKKKTDMIILDYEMPGESGADVLRKIRDNDATSNLPVVFLTGITDKEKIQKVLSYKPQGYLLKPVEREKLLQIISNTIG
ncbi:MAG: response regulator [Lachnospiraceae bacterium]|nr:response regulator [Lachnospiraceae bacterium]